jgi:hypothetical protein
MSVKKSGEIKLKIDGGKQLPIGSRVHEKSEQCFV